jgi:signal transduction histidine kinase
MAATLFKIQFLGVFAFLPQLFCAQISEKDSLWWVVRGERADSNAVLQLCQIGDATAVEQTDSADIYYQTALQLAQKQGYVRGISTAYRALAYHFGYRKNDAKAGLTYAHTYLNWAKRLRHTLYEGKAYFAFAVIYQAQRNVDSARFFYDKVIPILEQEEPEMLGAVYSNLTMLYENSQFFSKALEYNDKSLWYYEKIADTIGIIGVFVNKGKTYSNLKNVVAEKLCYQKALVLAEKIGDSFLKMTCFNNLAQVYSEQKQYDSSTFFLKKALALSQNVGTKEDEIRLKRAVAFNLFQQNKTVQAHAEIEKLVKDTIGAPLALQRIILGLQYEVLVALKKHDAAHQVNQKYWAIDAVLVAADKGKELLAFDEKLKKSEQTQSLLQKEREIAQQRTTIAYLLVGLITVALVLLGFFYRQKLKNEAQKQAFAAWQREQTLEAARAKLEGQLDERLRIAQEIHDDLGTSMTSISLLSEVLKKKITLDDYPEIERIAATSAAAVDTMNSIIWTLNSQNDNLQSLVAYLRKFATQFTEDAQISLVFESNASEMSQKMDGTTRRHLYLCVKEAIHNSIKHAQASQILVKIAANTEGVKIEIRDNGTGFSAADLTPHNGNGLKNMAVRMAKIGGSYLSKNEGGTTVVLVYPFPI